MDDLADKRVFTDRGPAGRLLVAAAPGLVAVAVSDDRVGEFGVAHRCSPLDLAVGDDALDAPARLAVATDADVLVADEPDPDGLEPTDHGPAAAVTVHGGAVLAASPAGRLAAHRDRGWEPITDLPAPATAIDGDLVGTTAGVFRLVDGELRPAGLADVTDVARAAGVPLAATADGLYALGNGWMDVLPGAVRMVAGAADGRAHAATDSAFYERSAGEWRAVALPTDGPVAAVAYGDRTYAITERGDLLIETDDGWTSQPLGVDDVRAAVVL